MIKHIEKNRLMMISHIADIDEISMPIVKELVNGYLNHI